MKLRLKRSYKTTRNLIGAVCSGPRVLAILPAFVLIGYWLGGEDLLLAVALGLPLCLGAAGAFGAVPPQDMRDGDDLRQPHNRDALEKRIDKMLAQAGRQARRTGCFLVSIDDFDPLLDRFGQSAAEEVLARTGTRLKAALRTRDQVFRTERGQFGIIVAPVRQFDLEIALQLANRLQRATEEPIALGGATVYVSVSIGLSLDSQFDRCSGHALGDAAARALSEASQYGPSAIRVYSPDFKPLKSCPHVVADELTEALRNGEIRPWYQPQISTDTGQISGFEALARWVHPAKGVIAPADFLTCVERGGQIERLGHVVLEHALGALKQWDDSGFSVPHVGVNFSSEELRNPQLVDKITWSLDKFGLAPERLAVEILETVVATSPDDTIARNISGLSELGCVIDLDDFGTGHASISSIRRFEIKRLKIDRSFVIKVDKDPEQQRMVSAILLMADRLELDTLAEGVETAGEHSMLSQLGCGHVQGFGIGRPMPLETTGDWITAHQKKLRDPPPIGRRSA